LDAERRAGQEALGRAELERIGEDLGSPCT